MWDTRFEMVSEWMANGCINEYVKAHPGVNRFGLVGPPFLTSLPPLNNNPGPFS